MDSGEPKRFEQVCANVAMVAHNAGVSIAKVPGVHAITVSGNGATATFPIPCDEADWRKTSVDEAFYAAIVDAMAFAGVSDGDALKALDSENHGATTAIRKGLNEEKSRLSALEMVMGSDAFAKLIAAAGPEGDAANANGSAVANSTAS